SADVDRRAAREELDPRLPRLEGHGRPVGADIAGRRGARGADPFARAYDTTAEDPDRSVPHGLAFAVAVVLNRLDDDIGRCDSRAGRSTEGDGAIGATERVRRGIPRIGRVVAVCEPDAHVGRGRTCGPEAGSEIVEQRKWRLRSAAEREQRVALAVEVV